MKKWKGVILAGGTGSRLYPVTQAISKQLIPVYDKPMIYYPFSVLMLAEIKDILIITTSEDQVAFQKLLGDGSNFGVNLQYAVQNNPNGLAEAFIIGEAFIGSDNVCLILGDNIFYGQGFKDFLTDAKKRDQGATVFAYKVIDPERFGVVQFDKDKKAISIEEKPKMPKSNFALTGLYFYDNSVVKISKNIKPSNRGELEITDVNKVYLEKGSLNVEEFGRGFAWLDTGTHNNLIKASIFVQLIEERQGLKIACLEEIAFQNGWITREKLVNITSTLGKTSYSNYLREIAHEQIE
jgi:glucose-1-phosphate thymidylyltransferase